MTYDLYLGDRSYSSWSLRGWLLFEKFDIPVRSHFVNFADPAGVGAQMAEVAPAKTVPTLKCADGAVVSESLALAEELASREPGKNLWPKDPVGRAVARNLASEMHAGFGPLREFCPMNLRVAYRNVAVPDDVTADLRRLEAIWSHARATASPGGPWLAGDYSIADAFYAPVAARIAGYGLAVDADAKAYVAAHLSDPAFRRWRAMGFAAGQELPWYKRDFDQTEWPGPEPMTATAVSEGTAENEMCPYSGKPITHLGSFDGRIFGFCNAFCRDKTVADAEAWPAFMAIYQS
ncbi:glutathione S-transferase [uncultured Litoreibacter sp.]|uniref:glutathione S-transferase n=1 Tax=uncultured Litoreibacter sp. TaxID=1392394 RepID=UPI0026360C3D|nr:glutathione S-transferase [uncultured Litoreibacter sp.]